MRLLATSTAEKRNTVRILFYGQSITEQKWGLNLDGVKLLVSRASMNQSSQRMWNPCFRILEMKRLGAPVSNIEPDRASPQLRLT